MNPKSAFYLAQNSFSGVKNQASHEPLQLLCEHKLWGGVCAVFCINLPKIPLEGQPKAPLPHLEASWSEYPQKSLMCISPHFQQPEKSLKI